MRPGRAQKFAALGWSLQEDCLPSRGDSVLIATGAACGIVCVLGLRRVCDASRLPIPVTLLHNAAAARLRGGGKKRQNIFTYAHTKPKTRDWYKIAQSAYKINGDQNGKSAAGFQISGALVKGPRLHFFCVCFSPCKGPSLSEAAVHT